jgi:hypothetical protein
MKTILLLSDETRHSQPLLQDAVRIEVTLGVFGARAGCNCDRWGHPCPDCVERNIKPKAELPISRPVKQAR